MQYLVEHDGVHSCAFKRQSADSRSAKTHRRGRFRTIEPGFCYGQHFGIKVNRDDTLDVGRKGGSVCSGAAARVQQDLICEWCRGVAERFRNDLKAYWNAGQIIVLGRFVLVFEITHERLLVASRLHYSFEEKWRTGGYFAFTPTQGF